MMNKVDLIASLLYRLSISKNCIRISQTTYYT